MKRVNTLEIFIFLDRDVKAPKVKFVPIKFFSRCSNNFVTHSSRPSFRLLTF